MKGKVRNKRAKALDRANSLLASIPSIEGVKPNPCPLKVEATWDEEADPLDVQAYKLVECFNYDACVTVASIANWDDVSCRACGVFKRVNKTSRLIRKIQQMKQAILHKFRLIRKIKTDD